MTSNIPIPVGQKSTLWSIPCSIIKDDDTIQAVPFHSVGSFSLCRETCHLLTRIPQSLSGSSEDIDMGDTSGDIEIVQSLGTMPLEILSMIMSYLTKLSDIKNCRLVNSTWDRLLRRSISKIDAHSAAWINFDFLQLFYRLSSCPPIRFPLDNFLDPNLDKISEIKSIKCDESIERTFRRINYINIMITLPPLDDSHYASFKRIGYLKIFEFVDLIHNLTKETFRFKKIDVGLYTRYTSTISSGKVTSRSYRPLFEAFQCVESVLCYPSSLTLHPSFPELINKISKRIVGINLYLLQTLDYFKICPNLTMIRIASRSDFLPYLGFLLAKYPQINKLFFQRWSGHYRQSLVEHFSGKLLEFLASVETPIRRKMSLLLPFSQESLKIVREKFFTIEELGLYERANDPNLNIEETLKNYLDLAKEMRCSRLIVYRPPFSEGMKKLEIPTNLKIEFIYLDCQH